MPGPGSRRIATSRLRIKEVKSHLTHFSRAKADNCLIHNYHSEDDFVTTRTAKRAHCSTMINTPEPLNP